MAAWRTGVVDEPGREEPTPWGVPEPGQEATAGAYTRPLLSST